MIEKVQKTLLEIGKSVAAVLETHDIPYMIAFGTLLGAVRHKGFIPWDDDFDFYLFDDSYDKAIEYLRKELPKNLFLEDEKSEPLYFHGWAHVKDLDTIAKCSAYEHDGVYAHHGISVDLYRTKEMPIAELESFLADENNQYIDRRLSKGLISEEEYCTRKERIENDRIKILQSEFEDANERVFPLVPIYKCHCMKRKYVYPLRRYRFEDTEFWGPNDADGILTDIYGNYMTLPPLEKRKAHYSEVIFT